MYTLQHLGFPTTRSPHQIDESEWQGIQTYETVDQAHGALQEQLAPLRGTGSWDNHYRVIDESGNAVDFTPEWMKY